MPKQADPESTQDRSQVLFRSLSGTFTRLRSEGEGDDEVYRYEFKASSDAVIQLWGNTFEKLEHTTESIRLDWLASGNAPLLWMHSRSKNDGIIEEARLEGNHIVVVVRMSPNAQERIADIEAEVIKNVSIGYRIHKETPDREFDENGNVIRTTWTVTDWEPVEVSLVTIPADRTVGFGRGEEDAAKSRDRKREQELQRLDQQSQNEDTTMPQDNTDTGSRVSVEEAENQRKQGVNDERMRSVAITAAANAARESGFGDFSDKVREFIDEGKSVEEFQRHILENGKRTTVVSTSDLGLTDKERKRYDISNVVLGVLNKDLDQRAGFEMEVSRAHQDAIGKDASRVAIPADIMLRSYIPKNERLREMIGVGLTGAGQSNTAGNIVATDLLPELFVESLREQSNILSRITMLPGLTGDVEIPIELLNPDFYWIGEEESPTEGNYGLDKFKLEFKSVAAKIPFSRKSGKQTTPVLENLLTASLRRGLSLALARAVVNGTGGAQPRGILQTPGIGAVPTTGTLDRTKFRTLRKALGDANVDVSRASGLCNSTGEFTITDTPLDEGSGKFLGDVRGGGVRTIIGDFDTTNIVPAGTIIYGDFLMYFMGMWGGVEIDRDTATGADTGSVYLRFFQDVDGITPRGADFAAITDL